MSVNTLIKCNPMCKAQSSTMHYWGISHRECVYRYWKKCIQHEEYKCHFKWTGKNIAWGLHWHSSLHQRELFCVLPLLQGDLELGSVVIEVAGWLKKNIYIFSSVLFKEPWNAQDGGEKFKSLSPKSVTWKASQEKFSLLPFWSQSCGSGTPILSFTETAVQEDKVKTIHSLA